MKELVEIKFKELCAEYIVKNLVNYKWEKTNNSEAPYIKEIYHHKKQEFVMCSTIFALPNQEINQEFWEELIIQQIENCEEKYETYDIHKFYKKMKQIIDLDNYSEYRELLDDKESIFQLFDINFLPCEKIDKYYGINFDGFS